MIGNVRDLDCLGRRGVRLNVLSVLFVLFVPSLPAAASDNELDVAREAMRDGLWSVARAHAVRAGDGDESRLVQLESWAAEGNWAAVSNALARWTEAQGAALPYPYFLQDGLVDEWPITPYLAWKPLETDRRPWVRCEFGKTCRFSKVVVSRCRDEAGRIRLLAGRLVANGRELASFDAERGCRLELTFPAVEADSVTLELVRRDGMSQCRDLSEIEVY